MDDELPDDCAIEVTYNANKTPQLQLQRPHSRGKNYSAIDYKDGNLTIKHPKNQEGIRYTISFHLSKDDQSGGFKGIKIWKDGQAERDWNDFSNTPFDLYTYHSADGRTCTILSIGDSFSTKATYNYCLGVFTDRSKGTIYRDDPQIYNTGDIGTGDGGRWRTIKAFLRRVFGQ